MTILQFLQLCIYRAFDAHCRELHGADYECCPHPRCRLWVSIERAAWRWLYPNDTPET